MDYSIATKIRRSSSSQRLRPRHAVLFYLSVRKVCDARGTGMVFSEILTFGSKSVWSGAVHRAVVTHVDAPIAQCIVVTRDGGQCTTHIEPGDCHDALVAIVQVNDSISRIECDIEYPSRRIVNLHLCIDMVGFEARAPFGGVRSEEHVIHLCRAVWRESRVCTQIESDDVDGGCLDEGNDTGDASSWNNAHPLLDHQVRAVRWMRRHEATFPRSLQYCGNIRVSQTWYVDVESERLTQCSNDRQVRVRGGLCASKPGSGKTAIALRVIAEGRGRSLVIVPLNLISQWNGEIEKFLGRSLRVCVLIRGQDIRDVTLQDLNTTYDIVITTFSFLRTNSGYLDMVDAALGGRPRTSAVLSSWARQTNHSEPVLEAVRWSRIVIDEIHDVFERPRDMRMLQLFQTDALWGLSGTPVLDDTSHAQAMYTFLAREESHHPHLLAALVSRVVWKDSCPEISIPRSCHLRLVSLSPEERLRVNHNTDENVEAEVRLTSFVDSARSDASDPTEQFRQIRSATRDALVLRLTEHDQAIGELTTRLPSLEHAATTGDASESLQRVHRQLTRDIQRLQALRQEDVLKLDRFDNEEETVRRQLTALSSTEGDGRRQGVGGLGTKMREIGALIAAHDATILFVQWKSMTRGIRAYLRGIPGLRVYQLEGNSSQRAHTLAEFLQGGVLILCLEECFAGLHLTHVRTIVFAHAIVGDHDTVQRLEEQAIARCVRYGQDECVHVYSFVISESAEEELWMSTHSHRPYTSRTVATRAHRAPDGDECTGANEWDCDGNKK